MSTTLLEKESESPLGIPVDARPQVTIDANEAVARVAYLLSEVIAIYPITPSSNMGEWADQWAAQQRPNLWGSVPSVVEMQSEGGAAGALHGALQTGALATTFTASQGLLLMIPNMYKIAGDMTPTVIHVAARSLAAQGLSIFGDHSDVMAARATGWAMLASNSPQEAADFAVIAHAATLETRIPFVHFFDGFRTSHEVSKIDVLADDDLRALLDAEAIAAHRARALTPDHPVLRGTAQNPDTFFQAREAANSFYADCPGATQAVMDRFAERTGRRYHLFDYVGHPEAERVLVLMGSGAETAHATVEWLVARGERVGVLKVRLFRPFSVADFVAALPGTVRAVAVLDRTKEPGAPGEPLYLDVLAALAETGRLPEVVVGGRYGLASKEFTPAMVQAVLRELAAASPRRRFTVGIVDDVTGTSLPVTEDLDIEPPGEVGAVFYGLGSDGTVGANKNSIKILTEDDDRFGQGYFVYDSKKAGAVTVSHLRFGPAPIRAPYLLRRADFVGCHQFGFLERLDVLALAAPGATVLLNAPYGREAVWDHLPREVQETMLAKQVRLFVIDAYGLARELGLGGRINAIMQSAFFALSGVLPRETAVARIKEAIARTYARKGAAVVERNCAAVDASLAALHEVPLPERVTATGIRPPVVPDEAPDFVQRVTAALLAGHGDLLPVSAFPVDGTWPLGTARWEKRGLAREIPVWDAVLCIQCNKCALMCPHAAIRAKVYAPEARTAAPTAFKATGYRAGEFRGLDYTIQVAPDDCTGCGLCVEVCPAKDRSNPRHKAIDMAPLPPLAEAEREDSAIFMELPVLRS